MTIEQVAAQTRVPIRYLHAIEDEQFEIIPDASTPRASSRRSRARSGCASAGRARRSRLRWPKAGAGRGLTSLPPDRGDRGSGSDELHIGLEVQQADARLR
ncbi:helix-turn-helix domain-containing protein [Ditylenchus destructor]|uniref:Helix-turn-helix domain-containing protein n=1 Tax=Ditylenchus destructor TaxID=166010 RepID=A0AAD4MI88_9BILA|nr:helix-turn-helix domain-containing protein [Ditylenchus destructor]